MKVEVIGETVRVLEGFKSGDIINFKDYYFLIGAGSVNQSCSSSKGEQPITYLESYDKYYREDSIEIYRKQIEECRL